MSVGFARVGARVKIYLFGDHCKFKASHSTSWLTKGSKVRNDQ